MRTNDLLQLSTRMFKARTGRTALTVLGMGIGIGTILFLVGMGYGLQKLLLEAVTTSETLVTLDIAASNSDGAVLSRQKTNEIGKMEGVAEIVPDFELRSQLVYNDTVSDASAVITGPDFIKLDGKKIVKGTGLDDSKPNAVVVSSAFYKIFDQSADEMLGKQVNFSLFVPKNGNSKETDKIETGQTYEISGFVDNEELTFYVNSKSLDSQLSAVDFSRVKVKCQNELALEPVKNKLTEEKFVVSSLSDTVKEVNKMFTGVKTVLAFFGLVALMVSAIGMFNTMTVTLLERTKEIGIMKSIGASESDILFTFIVESTIMGFLGGVAGIIFGILGGTAFNLILNIIAVRFGGKAIALFSYPIWFVLFILGFATFIGFATGVVPARRASVIDPLDALRSK